MFVIKSINVFNGISLHDIHGKEDVAYHWNKIERI